MAVIFANNASSTLGAAITAAATTITVQTVDATKFPSPAAGDFFPITIVDPATSTLYEIMYCTARSGNSLTVTRAREGTTAKAFPISSPAELRLTAALIMVDAPATGSTFGRNNGAWVEATGGGVGGEWTWNAGTAGPPAAAEVRFNNATQNSATQLFISATNAGNANLGVQLAALEAGSLILLQDKAAPTVKFKQFRTTGPTVNNSGWFTIPVVLKWGGGDLTAARVVIDFNNVPVDVATPSIPAPDYSAAPTGADGATDFNTLLKAGWQPKMYGPSNPNIPVPSTYWYVQTLVYFGTTYLTQVAYPYAVEPRLGIMMRAMNNGTWGNWVSQTPAGQVSHFAMSTPPPGWLKANGALVNRVTYAALFAAIGTTWGAGDGSTTFALPDMRGSFVRGWDDARGWDTSRVFGSLQDHAVEVHGHTATGSSGNASVDHTHAFGTLSMGTESADHTHTVAVSGTTGANSVGHTHTFADNASATGNASANHAHNLTPSGLRTAGAAAYVSGTYSPNSSSATDSTGAAHTHTVAVAGTTGGISANHTHTFSDASSATGGRSAAHTHAMAGSTAGHSATHSHTVAVTVAASVAPVAPDETRPINYALLACIKY